MSLGSRARRALLLLVTLLLAPLGGALAHPVLRSSTPPADARLTTLPTEVRLRFAGEVEPGLSRVTLRAPDGTVISAGPITQPADSGSLLVAPLRVGWMAGTYTLLWEVAGDDGHPVGGEYRFDVDASALPVAEPPAAGEAGPASAAHHPAQSFPEGERFDVQSPLYVAVRWLTFVGILGVVGAAAFGIVVLPLALRFERSLIAPLASSAADRAATSGLVAAAIVAASAALRLFAQLQALGGVEWDRARVVLAETAWGGGWLLQVAAALLAMVGFAIVRSRSKVTSTGGDFARVTYGRWALIGASAVIMGLSAALSGHAATVPSWTAAAITIDTLHLLSAGGWMGGLLMVMIAGLPATLVLEPGRRAVAGAALVSAFSPAALGFAAVTTMTGVFSASMHLDAPGDLWVTSYGRVLLAKLAVLSLLFVVGLYNWRRVKPALGTDEATARLRRSAAAELLVAIAVLLVTAVLVATPPMTP